MPEITVESQRRQIDVEKRRRQIEVETGYGGTIAAVIHQIAILDEAEYESLTVKRTDTLYLIRG